MSWQRDALVTIEKLRARLQQVEYEQKEPIAIVGMGCRYPGGVGDPGTFWRLLDEGIDAVTEVPSERWDVDALYDPDPNAPGKMTTRSGGFLAGIDRFDPGFFGILPREAVSMDPQQRLLLETSWETLERAGIAAERLVGSSTGVFVGMNYQEYGMLAGGLERLDGYVGTGTTASVASGRISYVLGLQGPSMTVDTACSSSLVTVHLACQALRQGECSLALAGGVTLMLTPGPFVEFSRLRGLAADGRCKTFSANADGTTWSEGCGMVVLERLSEARKNGHPVLAVIRGSAVNQDGRSNGLSAPNGPSQEAVIRSALAQAGVEASAVGYVECHGTGTVLGDPIEVQALGTVLAEGREADRPVIIGSVKSNLGHTDAAAGVAGLIKVVLSLQHGRIPKNLHFEAPNPHIAWDELPVKVASEAVPWVRNGAARIAGVSSFGVSGTNAHVVVEEAPVAAEITLPAAGRSCELVVLSAKSGEALEASAARLAEHVKERAEQSLGDIAYSLATTRSHHEHRLALAVATREELVSGLEAVSRGELAVGSVRGEVRRRGKTAWLFTGQGSQHVGMGRGLYEEWPAFREAFDAACAALDPHLDAPLREVMWEAPSRASLLDETGWTQPALFALEVALAALWRSWGVEPDVVAGHSIGEVTAAHVAGVFSLADAARLVAARGRLMQALPRGGAMVSIAASEAEVAKAVAAQAGRVSIAAVNSASSVVVSGEEEGVLAVSAAFAAKGTRTHRLRVSHAFHSALMDPMLEEFRRVAEQVTYRPAQIGVVSNVSGKVAGRQLSSAEYWVNHVREGVRFADGVAALHAAGVTQYLELGPRPTLLGLVPACLPAGAKEPVLVASLRPEGAEPTTALQALGAHYAQGGQLEWKGAFPSGGGRVELPTYPWQRQRYWMESSTLAPRAGVAKDTKGHPLLGPRVPLACAGAVYESVLSRSEQGWLYDHRVGGAALMPGAALMELVRAAGERCFGAPVEVLSLVLQSPLVLPEDGGQRVQAVVDEEDGRTEVSVYSQPVGAPPKAEWTLHASGEVRRSSAEDAPRIDLAAVRARCAEAAEVAQAYEGFASIGLDYGPAFQGLQSLWRGRSEALAEVSLPESVEGAERYGIHPALLDAAFQSLYGITRTPALNLPFAMAKMTVHVSGATSATVYARMRQQETGVANGEGLVSDVTLTDAQGHVLVEVAGLRGHISCTASRDTTMSGYGSVSDTHKKALLRVISEVTGLSEADVLDVDDFQDLGIDSVLRIQLANKVLALSPQTKARADEIVAVPSFSSLLSAFAVGENVEPGTKPTHDDQKNVIPANEPADDGSASRETTDLDNILTGIAGGDENAACHSLRVSGEHPLTVAGTLIVDETHPFFFDHPLDHVSGVQLIEAVNQICHVANRPEGRRYQALTAATFAFNSFCEKQTHATVQVLLEGMQADTRNYSCLVTQGGRKLLTGRCSFSSIEGFETLEPKIAAPNYPLCRKTVVNKTNEQNVFISELTTQAGNMGCWVRPASDNRTFNCAQKDGLIDAVYLIEACRQAAKLFGGRASENDPLRNGNAASGPDETFGVLKSIEIRIWRPVGIREAVFLTPGELTITSAGANSLVDSRCNLFVDDIQIGSFDMKALILSANTYANWRGATA
jgi:acyl transferase domain-containing protein